MKGKEGSKEPRIDSRKIHPIRENGPIPYACMQIGMDTYAESVSHFEPKLEECDILSIHFFFRRSFEASTSRRKSLPETGKMDCPDLKLKEL